MEGIILTVVIVAILIFFIYMIKGINDRMKRSLVKVEHIMEGVRQMVDSMDKYKDELEDIAIGHHDTVDISKLEDFICAKDNENIEDKISSTPYDNDGRGSVLENENIVYPDVTLEDVKNKNYSFSPEERVVFPLIDDGFPTIVLLPLELVAVLRKEFNLENYENPIMRDQFIHFILENNIKIGIKHLVGLAPHNLKSNITFPSAPSKIEPKDMKDAIGDNDGYLKIIRYVEGGEVIEKVVKSNELYVSYINTFSDVMTLGLPSGSQFLDWFNNAIDELIRLEDYDSKTI